MPDISKHYGPQRENKVVSDPRVFGGPQVPMTPEPIELDVNQIMKLRMKGTMDIFNGDDTVAYYNLAFRDMVGDELSQIEQSKLHKMEHKLRVYRGQFVNIAQMQAQMPNNPSAEEIGAYTEALEDSRAFLHAWTEYAEKYDPRYEPLNDIVGAFAGYGEDLRPETLKPGIVRGLKYGAGHSLVALFTRMYSKSSDIAEDERRRLKTLKAQKKFGPDGERVFTGNAVPEHVMHQNRYILSIMDLPQGTFEKVSGILGHLVPDLPLFGGVGKGYDWLAKSRGWMKAAETSKLARTLTLAGRSASEFGVVSGLQNLLHVKEGTMDGWTAAKQTGLSALTGALIGTKTSAMNTPHITRFIEETGIKYPVRTAAGNVLFRAASDVAIMAGVEATLGHGLARNDDGSIAWSEYGAQMIAFGLLGSINSPREAAYFAVKRAVNREQVRDEAMRTAFQALMGRQPHEYGGITKNSEDFVMRERLLREMGYELGENGALRVVDGKRADEIVEMVNQHMKPWLEGLGSDMARRGVAMPERLVKQLTEIAGVEYEGLRTPEGQAAIARRMEIAQSEASEAQSTIHQYNSTLADVLRRMSGTIPDDVTMSFLRNVNLERNEQATQVLAEWSKSSGNEIPRELNEAVTGLFQLRSRYNEAQRYYSEHLYQSGRMARVLMELQAYQPIAEQAKEVELILGAVSKRTNDRGEAIEVDTMRNASKLLKALVEYDTTEVLAPVNPADDVNVLRTVAKSRGLELTTAEVTEAYATLRDAGLKLPRVIGEFADGMREVVGAFGMQAVDLYNKALEAQKKLDKQGLTQVNVDEVLDPKTGKPTQKEREQQITQLKSTQNEAMFAWGNLYREILRGSARRYLDDILPTITESGAELYSEATHGTYIAQRVADAMKMLRVQSRALPPHHPLRYAAEKINDTPYFEKIYRETVQKIVEDYSERIRVMRAFKPAGLTDGELAAIREATEQRLRNEIDYDNQVRIVQQRKDLTDKQKLDYIAVLTNEKRRVEAELKQAEGDQQSDLGIAVAKVKLLSVVSRLARGSELGKSELEVLRRELGMTQEEFTQLRREVTEGKKVDKKFKQAETEAAKEVLRDIEIPTEAATKRHRLEGIVNALEEGRGFKELIDEGFTREEIKAAAAMRQFGVVDTEEGLEFKNPIHEYAYTMYTHLKSGMRASLRRMLESEITSPEVRVAEQIAIALRMLDPQGSVDVVEGTHLADFVLRQRARLVSNDDVAAPLLMFASFMGNTAIRDMLVNQPTVVVDAVARLGGADTQPTVRGVAQGIGLSGRAVGRAETYVGMARELQIIAREGLQSGLSDVEVFRRMVDAMPEGTRIDMVARFAHLIGLKNVPVMTEQAINVLGKSTDQGVRMRELFRLPPKSNIHHRQGVVEAYLTVMDSLRSEGMQRELYTNDSQFFIRLRNAGKGMFPDVDNMLFAAQKSSGLSVQGMKRIELEGLVKQMMPMSDADRITDRHILLRLLKDFGRASGSLRGLPSELRSDIAELLLTPPANKSLVQNYSEQALGVLKEILKDTPVEGRFTALSRSLVDNWVRAVNVGNGFHVESARKSIADIAAMDVVPPRKSTMPWDAEIRTRDGEFVVLKDGTVIEKPAGTFEMDPIEGLKESNTLAREIAENVMKSISEDTVLMGQRNVLENLGTTIQNAAEGLLGRKTKGIRNARQMANDGFKDPNDVISTVVDSYRVLDNGQVVVQLRNHTTKTFAHRGNANRWLRSKEAAAYAEQFARADNSGESGRVNPATMLTISGVTLLGGLTYAFGTPAALGVYFGGLTYATLRQIGKRRRLDPRFQREVDQIPGLKNAVKFIDTAEGVTSRGVQKLGYTFGRPFFLFPYNRDKSVNPEGFKGVMGVRRAHAAMTTDIRHTTMDIEQRAKDVFGIGTGLGHAMHLMTGGKIGLALSPKMAANLLLMRIPSVILRDNVVVDYDSNGRPRFSEKGNKRTAGKSWMEMTGQELYEAVEKYYNELRKNPRLLRQYDQRFFLNESPVSLTLALRSLTPKAKRVIRDMAADMRRMRAQEMRHARNVLRRNEPTFDGTPEHAAKRNDKVIDDVGPTVAAYLSNFTYDAMVNAGEVALSYIKTKQIGDTKGFETELNAKALEVVNDRRVEVKDKQNALVTWMEKRYGLDRAQHGDQLVDLASHLITQASQLGMVPGQGIYTRAPSDMFVRWYNERLQTNINTVDFIRAYQTYAGEVKRKVYLEAAVYDAVGAFNRAFTHDPKRREHAMSWLSDLTRNPAMLDMLTKYAGTGVDRVSQGIAQLGYFHVLWASPRQLVLDMSTMLLLPQGDNETLWHARKAFNTLLIDNEGAGKFFHELFKSTDFATQAVAPWEQGFSMLKTLDWWFGKTDSASNEIPGGQQRAKHIEFLTKLRDRAQNWKNDGTHLKSVMMELGRNSRELGDFVSFAEYVNHFVLGVQQIHAYTYEALRDLGGQREWVKTPDGKAGLLVKMRDGTVLDPMDVFMESYKGKHGKPGGRRPLVDVDKIIERAMFDADTTLGIFSGINLSPVERYVRRIPIIGRVMSSFTSFQWNMMSQYAHDIGVLMSKKTATTKTQREISMRRLRRRATMVTAIGGVTAWKSLLSLGLYLSQVGVEAFVDDDELKRRMPTSFDDPRFIEMLNTIDDVIGVEHFTRSPVFALISKATGMPVPDIGGRVSMDLPYDAAWRTSRESDVGIRLFGPMHDAIADMYTLSQFERTGSTKESSTEAYDAAVRLMGVHGANAYFKARYGFNPQLKGNAIPQTNPIVPLSMYYAGAFVHEMNLLSEDKYPSKAMGERRRMMPHKMPEIVMKNFVASLASEKYGDYSASQIRWRRKASKAETQLRDLWIRAHEVGLQSDGGAGEDFMLAIHKLNQQAWQQLPIWVNDERTGKKRFGTPEDFSSGLYGVTGIHPSLARIDVRQEIFNRNKDKILPLSIRNTLDAPTSEQMNEYVRATDVLLEAGYMEPVKTNDGRVRPLLKRGHTLPDIAVNAESNEVRTAATMLIELTYKNLDPEFDRARQIRNDQPDD